MKIGVIGAGNIGATLVRKLAASGHEVKLANSKGPDSIRDLAHDLGAVAVSKEQAVRDVEVVVLSIPFARYPDLAGLFSDVPAEVVVIDTSNYYPFRDGTITEVDAGKPESVWVSEQIGRPIIKAWNAVLADTLSAGESRRARRDASPSRSPATTQRRRQRRSDWWTPPDLTRWMRARSPSPGGSSPAPRATAPNSRCTN